MNITVNCLYYITMYNFNKSNRIQQVISISETYTTLTFSYKFP